MIQTLNNNVILTQEKHSDNILDQFDSIVANLTIFKTHISLLQQQVRILDKTVKKQMNLLKKESVKNKTKGCRKPSGFARPTKVTNELCNFMNKTEGSDIARTDVTRTLVAYIKEQKLEDKNNSRVIMPDCKLQKLLGVDENQEVTYFNIQKYMNKHFISSKTSSEVNK